MDVRFQDMSGYIDRMLRDQVTQEVTAKFQADCPNILVPPEVLAAHVDTELSRRKQQSADRQEAYLHRVRFVILTAMSQLDDALRDFEHTTHCHLGNGSIEMVCEEIAKAFHNPSGFTISNLSQSIQSMLERYKIVEQELEFLAAQHRRQAAGGD
jgi:hypothetical protein